MPMQWTEYYNIRLQKIRNAIQSPLLLTWAVFGPYWAPGLHQGPPHVHRVRDIAEISRAIAENMCFQCAFTRQRLMGPFLAN